MIQSFLPQKFWKDAVLTATYIINRLPAYILHWKSPYELLYGRAPDVGNLRNFGCLCYATNTMPCKQKFDYKDFACIFLGYPADHKGYKLLDLKKNELVISRDVRFYDSVFPCDPNFVKDPLIPTQEYVDDVVEYDMPESPVVSPIVEIVSIDSTNNSKRERKFPQ
ncbi:hypothetical protein LIER_10173 [Lithospermum erythrorhizon]|uniref:Retroviral polymerase SH3-like domain-containing protein n=1 Tax=Lithospermum erythrorhizon TaxID=34254 RepID=A0AAV3PI92_LITER